MWLLVIFLKWSIPFTQLTWKYTFSLFSCTHLSLKWNIISFEHTSKNTSIIGKVTAFNYSWKYLPSLSSWISDSALCCSGAGNNCSGINTREVFTKKTWKKILYMYPWKFCFLSSFHLVHSIIIVKILEFLRYFDAWSTKKGRILNQECPGKFVNQI